MGFLPQLFWDNFVAKKSFCQVDCQVEDPLCNCMIVFIHLEGKGCCPSFVEGALTVASLLQAVQEAHDSRDLNTSRNY